jgi:hypothetical protein
MYQRKNIREVYQTVGYVSEPTSATILHVWTYRCHRTACLNLPVPPYCVSEPTGATVLHGRTDVRTYIRRAPLDPPPRLSATGYNKALSEFTINLGQSNMSKSSGYAGWHALLLTVVPVFIRVFLPPRYSLWALARPCVLTVWLARPCVLTVWLACPCVLTVWLACPCVLTVWLARP